MRYAITLNNCALGGSSTSLFGNSDSATALVKSVQGFLLLS